MHRIHRTQGIIFADAQCRDGPGISSVGSTGAGGISCRCSSGKAGRGVAGGSGVSENLFCGKENSLDVGGLICLFRSWSVSFSTLIVGNGRDRG